MAFIFRLEKVKRHRQRLVDEQGRAVAAANLAMVAVAKRLADLEGELARHLAAISPSAHEKVCMRDLMDRTRWVEHLKEAREQTLAELHESRVALASEQEVLNRRWRDVEVLKKLHEKQQYEWQMNQLRLENKVLDEVGQIRADRQRRSKIAT